MLRAPLTKRRESHDLDSLLGCQVPGNVRDLAVVGTTVYVTDRAFGLLILDFTDCPPCPADFTNDGVLDFFDVSAFMSAFGSSDPIADITGDGIFDFFDVAWFMAAFNAGCP